MADIGVRELKARASEIVRNVRKRRARYIITYRGRPVGLLAPLEQAPATALAGQQSTQAWDMLVELGTEIGQGWRSPLTSVELLSQSRR